MSRIIECKVGILWPSIFAELEKNFNPFSAKPIVLFPIKLLLLPFILLHWILALFYIPWDACPNFGVKMLISPLRFIGFCMGFLLIPALWITFLFARLYLRMSRDKWDRLGE